MPVDVFGGMPGDYSAYDASGGEGDYYYPAPAEQVTAEATMDPAVARGNAEVSQALTIGGTANPLIGLAVVAGAVIAVGLLAKGVEDANLANIRATAYNMFIIGGAAVATIPLWKAIFTAVKIPGVSTYVLSV